MRPKRIVAIAIAVLIVASTAWLRSRDPERQDLDATARGGVTGQFVKLTDGTTHYEVQGPEGGTRVMLVHGFSVPSYIWDSTAIALSGAGFRVARYDYYGRGWSDRPNVRYDSDLYDRQLGELLDSLGWKEPVHLVGLSFGGPVTAGFTGRHPERVRSLTLVDPAAGPSTGGVPWFFRIPGLGPLLWQAMVVPGMAGGQLSDFVEPAKWPDWPDRYRPQMRFRGFGRALLRTRQDFAWGSLDSVYAGVGRTGLPVMLIWGKEDQTVKFELSEGVRKAIPQVQFHAIERAGHLPHMERTDVVNPLLVSFLRGGAPDSVVGRAAVPAASVPR